jgi:hypothetical protein
MKPTFIRAFVLGAALAVPGSAFSQAPLNDPGGRKGGSAENERKAPPDGGSAATSSPKTKGSTDDVITKDHPPQDAGKKGGAPQPGSGASKPPKQPSPKTPAGK